MAEKTTLSDQTFAEFHTRLAADRDVVVAHYHGASVRRQPVHTVYGGAHLFRADTAPKLGQRARAALDVYGGSAVEFARGVGLGVPDDMALTVMERVRDKLAREPVEDFRIDFEDGYGNRTDEEEDGHARSAALEFARGAREGTLPPFHGIRIKPLSAELCRRSIRTLDIFLTALHEKAGEIPGNFVVTLPKITDVDQVAVLADLLDRLEEDLGLSPGTLKLELMIETTQSILSRDGRCNLPALANAARGRCVGAHFGTYDYTASCGITAAYQHMMHPACDFARQLMQVAYADTGIFLSDGATNIMPVPVHTHDPHGRTLTADQVEDNRRNVLAAWKLHADHIRHSLILGFYQGWDLHPAQLPTRYAAVYAFFLQGLPAASQRLANFVEKAAQATLAGDVFDDAATGQGLLNFFLRGIGCGAITEQEALATGLTLDEIRSRSFFQILDQRRKQALT
jgi:citrate lyase beta subunit